MDLDNVGALHVTKERPSASLVDSKERFKGIECAAVNVEVVWKMLAHRRTLARLVDRRGVSRPEKQFVGLPAGFRVCPEEYPQVTLEGTWQFSDRRTLSESGQGEIDQKVFGPALADRVPFVIAGHAPN